MIIFVTPFDPETKQATGKSVDSGFETLEDVEMVNGPPLRQGKRTRTYSDVFFSNYSLTDIKT